MNATSSTDVGGIYERMERMYRPQRHIYDLTRRYYLLGRDRLICELDMRPGQAVLEVGCGTGRNLVAIGRRYPGVLLCGVEPSRSMRDASAAALRRSGFERRTRLVHGTAETICPTDFGIAAFDRIVISYCLSMVDQPNALLAQIASHLVLGGRLELVDFGPMDGLPVLVRRGMVAWLDRFGVRHRPEVLPTLRGLAAAGRGVVLHRRLASGYAELIRYRRTM